MHTANVYESSEEQHFWGETHFREAVQLESLMPWRIEPIMERPEWVQMQPPWGRSAWDTGAELADMLRCLGANRNKIISMTNQYAKNNKIPGGHAEKFGHMSPPPADHQSDVQDRANPQARTAKHHDAATIEYSLVMRSPSNSFS